MASKTIGTLIKEARTAAGLTQAALAAKVTGVTAADIGKAERGEKDLTQAQIKEIAKATGVTQKSLLDAAAGKKTTAKTNSSKTGSAAKTTSKTSGTTITVTATEKKLVELYRKADADTQKEVMTLRKGTGDDAGILGALLEGLAGGKTGSSSGKKDDAGALLSTRLSAAGKTSSSSSGKKDDASALLGALMSQMNKK